MGQLDDDDHNQVEEITSELKLLGVSFDVVTKDEVNLIDANILQSEVLQIDSLNFRKDVAKISNYDATDPRDAENFLRNHSRLKSNDLVYVIEDSYDAAIALEFSEFLKHFSILHRVMPGHIYVVAKDFELEIISKIGLWISVRES